MLSGQLDSQESPVDPVYFFQKPLQGRLTAIAVALPGAITVLYRDMQSIDLAGLLKTAQPCNVAVQLGSDIFRASIELTELACRS